MEDKLEVQSLYLKWGGKSEQSKALHQLQDSQSEIPWGRACQ